MKLKIFKLTALLVLPAALLALASCSSTPEPVSDSTGLPEGVRGKVVIESVTTTATVQSVNAADRTVVIRHQDGHEITYKCGPDVRNFDQIHVGDHVTATLAESVAVGLIKGGGPTGVGTSSVMVRAPLGAKPGGRIVDTVGFVAKVVSVDTTRREVTLQPPDGGKQTVKVGPDVNLTDVKPGDDVGVKLTRAFAIAVTSAP